MDGGRIAAALALAVVALCHAAEEGRLPVPTTDQQQEAVNRFERDYRLSRADSPEQKLAIARELLALAEQLRHGSAAHRFAALRTATELACEAGDAELMLQTIDRVAAEFQVEAADARHRMLCRLAAKAHTGPAIRSLVTVARPLAEEAALRRDYAKALELATALESACRRMAGREHLPSVQPLVTQLRAEQERWTEVEAARKQLETGEDRAARFTVGLWLAFSEDDWSAGMQHLAECADPAWQQLAQRELTPPRTTAGCISLAELWYDCAAAAPQWTRSDVRRRAAFWYHVALVTLDSRREKQRIAERLETIDGADDIAPAAETWAARADSIGVSRLQADLPSLLNRGQVALCKIPHKLVEPISLEPVDEAAALPSGDHLESRQATGSAAAWDIFYTRESGTERSQAPLAHLMLSSRQLQFQWAYPLPDDLPIEQLSNCAVVIRDADHEINIGLRSTLAVEAPRLDIFADSNFVRLPAGHLPRRESLFLQLESLEDFPVPAKLNGSAIIGCGQQLELELTEVPGAVVRVELLDQGQELAVRLAVFVRYEGRVIELTDARLKTMKKATAGAHVDAQLKLRAATQQYTAVRKRTREVERWRPAKLSQRLAKTNMLRQLHVEAVGLREKIPTLKRRIVELGARLEQIPDWESLIESLHQAPLPFTIFFTTGHNDLTLVQAR